MSKKLLPIIPMILLLATLLSMKWRPSAAPLLGMTLVFFTLAISISSIFEKHKGTENPRPKIAKEVLALVATLLLIIFLGGLAGLFANYYASPRFGAAAGFVSALAASFTVGYFVKKGAGMLLRP